MRTSIKGILLGEISGEVTISGFIDIIREHKKYIFLVIRQKTEFLQVFMEKEKFIDLELKVEYFIEVSGVLETKKEVKLHGIELAAKEIKILSATLEELPITWKGEGYPSLHERLDHRHLSLREPKILLAFEMMSLFDLKVREFFYKKGFIEIHTPKIIGTSSEGGAELFEMTYFDKKAYLAQSPQIYKQMAIAAGFEKVLEIAPAFRADPSFTSRHVTEITMLDIEFGPIESYHEILELEEEMLAFTIQELAKEYGEKVKELHSLEIEIPTLPFPRMKFKQCIEILKEKFGIIIPEGEDMSSEGEKKLAEYIKEKFGHDFLFITEYPSSVRAFYTMEKYDEPGYSTGFDLIYKGLEVTSGAQREHRHDILRGKIIDKGMGVDGFYHYLEAFKHGIPPHGGLGFGFARLFKQMLGFETIKEMILMPRDPKRIFP